MSTFLNENNKTFCDEMVIKAYFTYKQIEQRSYNYQPTKHLILRYHLFPLIYGMHALIHNTIIQSSKRCWSKKSLFKGYAMYEPPAFSHLINWNVMFIPFSKCPWPLSWNSVWLKTIHIASIHLCLYSLNLFLLHFFFNWRCFHHWQWIMFDTNLLDPICKYHMSA